MNEGTLVSVSTTNWRAKLWKHLYDLEEELLDESVLDDNLSISCIVFFSNSAASDGFVSFLSYVPGKIKFGFSLALADIWFTASIWLISLGDGKVCKRNTLFKDTFKDVLPRSKKRICSDFHDVVS